MAPPPTPQLYAELQVAYAHFNAALFGSALPDVVLTLQRKRRSMGYFSADRFVGTGSVRAHEVALNPMYFALQPVEGVLSTLVHEQAHVWQHVFGTPGRRNYHNREWADRMIDLGLYPSATGRPGGAEVGEGMSHYIVESGAFLRACRALLRTDWALRWHDRVVPELTEAGLAALSATDGDTPLGEVPVRHAGSDYELRSPTAKDTSNRLRYSCPDCGVKVWGKPGLRLSCLTCSAELRPPRSWEQAQQDAQA